MRLTFITRCCHGTGNDLDVLGVELIAADDAGAPRRLAVSEGNQMRLLLIGAPGAGKGTQAERLAERFGITHISSVDMLRKPVVAAAEAGGYVLDGFPRTVEQARASFPTAHALGVEVQAAVHLDVARADLKRRLLARRRGSEDTEAVIERRLQVYLDKTVPLLEYYADREWMFTVDGAQPPDAVYADIVACLEGWWTSLRGPGQASRASGR